MVLGGEALQRWRQNAAAAADSVWPRRWQPTRLPRLWDSPTKNTGVGCHFLLRCMKEESESEIAQLCLTLSDPIDCSPPGSSVHGILQARILEGVAIPFSRESCFCWLYRASPSLAAKNIINLILVLSIWWCLCVDSPPVLLEKGFAMIIAFSWQNS